MAQTFFPITPVEVTPGAAGAWTDVDASAHIPSGATGVLLHCVNTHADTAHALGLRKNGSTDDRTDDLQADTHNWAAIGVDGSRIFEAYVGSTTDIDIYLVGYTTSGVTFFTNAYNKSISISGTWTDIDCSAEAPNAIGLIFEVSTVLGPGETLPFGLRKNGSTDYRTDGLYQHNTFGVIIGCDANQVVEGYTGVYYGDYVKFMLVGYITNGATFNTNAPCLLDGTAAQYETWRDLFALPASSLMGFIEVAGIGPYGLRKNGSAEDIYRHGGHPWAFVECDENYLTEAKIHHVYPGENGWAGAVPYLVGYATAPPPVVAPTATALPASAVTATTARSNGEVTNTGGENPTVHIYWGTSDGETTPGDWDHDENLGELGAGTFHKDLSSLTHGTKYYYRCFAVNSGGSTWSNAVEFTTLLEKPVGATNAATGVGVTVATINGGVTDDGGESCQYRFRYKKAGGAYVYTEWTGAKATGETFSESITGLDASSTYYFNAQVKNSAFESDWGAELTFNTGVLVVAPTGTTDPATLVADIDATLNGAVTGDGGEACEVRFQYGLTGAYGTNTAWQPGKLTGNTFSQRIYGLAPNTEYHFRAQIKNSDSTANGADRTFTTEFFPTPFIRRVLRDVFGGGADISAVNPLQVCDPHVVAATTIDLQQAAASYDLFTGTTQDVMLEKLVIRLPNVDVSDDVTITSIAIQTDDTTPQVFISAVTGAKVNLTAEAQLGWTGVALIKAGTKIQLTIAGGAADASTVCDVVAECRAVVAEGYLA